MSLRVKSYGANFFSGGIVIIKGIVYYISRVNVGGVCGFEDDFPRFIDNDKAVRNESCVLG